MEIKKNYSREFDFYVNKKVDGKTDIMQMDLMEDLNKHAEQDGKQYKFIDGKLELTDKYLEYRIDVQSQMTPLDN